MIMRSHVLLVCAKMGGYQESANHFCMIHHIGLIGKRKVNRRQHEHTREDDQQGAVRHVQLGGHVPGQVDHAGAQGDGGGDGEEEQRLHAEHGGDADQGADPRGRTEQRCGRPRVSAAMIINGVEVGEVVARFSLQVESMNRKELLMRLPQRSVGVEIGVFDGNSAQQMFDVVRPVELHLVDPWETYRARVYGERYREMDFGDRGDDETMQEKLYQSVVGRFAVYSGTVTVHRMTSMQFLAQCSSNYLDWAYIDGNHLFEAVLSDLFGCWRVVKPGGFIAGHDYGNVGKWEDGVTVAVDKFLESGLCDVVMLGSGGYEYLLRRK